MSRPVDGAQGCLDKHHMMAELRHGSIKEGLTYHVLGVITTAGMT